MENYNRLSRLPVMLLASLLVLFMGACAGDDTETGTMDDGADTGIEQGPALGQGQGTGVTTAEQLEGDPANYVGQEVRAEGQVQDLYSQNLFVIEGDWTGSELLVVVPNDVTTMETFADGDTVQVTGEVREYAQSEFEGQWDFDFSQVDYEEQAPAIVASEIQTGTMQGGQMQDGQMPGGQGGMEGGQSDLPDDNL